MIDKIDTPSIEDLKKIGQALKSKREELSYTLEHVSEITRINLTTLRNIEEGKLENVTGLVFIRGFIRNYAKLLGIESDWMIELLDAVFNPNHHTTAAAQSEHDRVESNNNVFLFSGLIAVIVIVIGFMYWNSKYNVQIASNTEVIEPVQATNSNQSNGAAGQPAVQDIAQIKKDVAVVTGAKPSVETPINAIIHPLNLVLVAKSNDWIRLAVDDAEAKEIQLAKGEKYEWPANEQYHLIMSTGDSAIIHLNGEEIEIVQNRRDNLFEMKLNKFSLTQLNN